MLHVCLSRAGYGRALFFGVLLFLCSLGMIVSMNIAGLDSLQFSTESNQRNGVFQSRGELRKSSVSTSYSVNIVIRFSGNVTLPKAPSIQIGNVHIQTVNYIVTNETYILNQGEVRMLAPVVNLTITNFVHDNDYLSFLLSIYYKSDIAVVLHLDQPIGSNELEGLIRLVVLDYISSSPKKPFILMHNPKLLCISNTLLRQVLMYSSIRYSDPSLYSLLPTLLPSEIRGKWKQSSQFLFDLPSHSLSNISFSKCFSTQMHRNSSFSVFLRLYQRNYLRTQLNGIFAQSLHPEFLFLVQNRNLTQFDYPAILREFEHANTPIYFVWNVNWNAFFHFSYLLSGFSPSRLSFTYDDDQILIETDIHARAIQAMVERPGIHSLRPWCWCKRYYKRTKLRLCVKQCEKAPDLVVDPFFAPSWVGKVMWRYDIPTYLCCEEMSYLLTANIQCGIRWYWMNGTYQSFQKDKLDRRNNTETKELMKKVDWRNLEHDTMTYYMKAGYKTSYAYDMKYLKMTQSVYPILRVCVTIQLFGLDQHDANIHVSTKNDRNIQSVFDYAIFASIWREPYLSSTEVSKIDVYSLTDDNFETLVGNGTNGTWFIHFYAPVK